jgi:hypothetical protein
MQRIAILSLVLTLGAASAARAQVNLEAKYPEGTSRTLQEFTRYHQILTIAGQNVETNVDASMTIRSEVGKRMPDGTLRVRNTFQRIQISLELPMGKLVYDSDKPGEAKSDVAELQAILDAERALKGATYTFVFDKDNKLTAVEGLQEILKGAPAGAMDTLKERLTEDRFKREHKQGLEILPGKPVNKGDKWQRTTTTDIGAGQTLKFDTFYQYEGTVERGGKTLDKISFFQSTVTYDLDPNSPIPLKVAKSDLKIDSSTGTILWDREAGQVVEKTEATHLLGPMTFSVNGMDLEGKVDLTIDTGTKQQ